MNVYSKMKPLADEIRSLSGISGLIGLDIMRNCIEEANTQVSEQTELIRQIRLNLEALDIGGFQLFSSVSYGENPTVHRGNAHTITTVSMYSVATGELQQEE